MGIVQTDVHPIQLLKHLDFQIIVDVVLDNGEVTKRVVAPTQVNKRIPRVGNKVFENVLEPILTEHYKVYKIKDASVPIANVVDKRIYYLANTGVNGVILKNPH